MFEWLVQDRFCFSLGLSEEDEAVFVELFSVGKAADGRYAVLDIAEIGHDFSDAQGAGWVDCVLVLVFCVYLVDDLFE
ncbi:hypothetical protein BBD39_07750 [Arsenophonus endosymbiont of Bemisia tabaci Asia II 3]|nr:hypothetical protein BBD39_07750 [Arsenophonus endosymbiont of Bemisia tabaci Asia II 3]